MPNHTQNFVTIETNTNVDEEIQALEELKNHLRIKEGKFDFEGIVPMPEEIKKGATLDFHNKDEGYINVMGVYVPKDELARRKLKLDYGADNWYDFACLHWGTKWNAYSVEVEQDDTHMLDVSFCTAWDSPREIAERIKIYCEKHNLVLDWYAQHEFEEGTEQIV
tara:strand:+ start:318 stop:812 length:495 start_codon:yes stop_codon:yes gene_type:complete